MKKINLELYRKLYLIRRSEEKIIEHYYEDEMKTPMHMSMGSEAISSGICHALESDDQVFGTYRSHALYLAKTGDVDDFFAEMYGKEISSLKGKGGSMHLCAPERGFMGTSAIVGSAIPVGMGAAFANKTQGNNKITAVFFGDGAIDEGAFWESLNVACLMQLPVLFICEDNGLAVHTFSSQRRGYRSIVDIVSQFNCNVLTEDTTDVEVIYNLAKKAVDLVKTNEMPCFICLKCYRYLEHVGVNKDFDACYRSEDEFKEWFKVDPVGLQREKLLSLGYKKEVNFIEEDISNRINKSIAKAKKAKFCNKSEIYKGVFDENNNLL